MKKITNKQQAIISLLLFSMLQMASVSAQADNMLRPQSNSSQISISSPANGISDVYSDIDMRLRLANKASKAACVANLCEENIAFDARVGSIGRYLSKAALQLYPNQEIIIQRMTFSVAEKDEPGTASNNKGQIIVLRGIQDLQLSDDALGFVIAREMSHVLAGHHKTNTSTKLIISALASVLFPAIAIVGASSAAAQASTATTLLTSAASTATSMLGGEVALAKMKPSQLSQADDMALAIMEKVEWDMRSAQHVLLQGEPAKTPWMLDLEVSRAQLANKIAQEDAQIFPLADDLLQTDKEQPSSTQTLNNQQDFELNQALEAEAAELNEQPDLPYQNLQYQNKQNQNSQNQHTQDVVNASNIEPAEQDGVKITPLPANNDVPSTPAP